MEPKKSTNHKVIKIGKAAELAGVHKETILRAEDFDCCGMKLSTDNRQALPSGRLIVIAAAIAIIASLVSATESVAQEGLHTIGPRIDLNLSPESAPKGAFISLAPGLALTEGDLKARAGIGTALKGGYRWRLGDGSTLGVLAGMHGHLYDEGNASVLT